MAATCTRNTMPSSSPAGAVSTGPAADGLSPASADSSFRLPYPSNERKKRSLPLTSLNHVSIHCRDVEASLKFYRDLMGFIPIKRPSCLNFDGAWLFNYGIGIHLLKKDDDDKEDAGKAYQINPRSDHVSFQCEDIEVVEALLAERGVPFVRQAVEEHGILVQQLFFHDPDHHMIEICNCDVLPVIPLPVGAGTPLQMRLNVRNSEHNSELMGYDLNDTDAIALGAAMFPSCSRRASAAAAAAALASSSSVPGDASVAGKQNHASEEATEDMIASEPKPCNAEVTQPGDLVGTSCQQMSALRTSDGASKDSVPAAVMPRTTSCSLPGEDHSLAGKKGDSHSLLGRQAASLDSKHTMTSLPAVMPSAPQADSSAISLGALPEASSPSDSILHPQPQHGAFSVQQNAFEVPAA